MSAARQVLLDLAERCEREEPSRVLNEAIERAIHSGGPFPITTAPYTTSLDAAVTLVPAGWIYRLGSFAEEGTHWAELNQPMHGATTESDRLAKSVALALCAAALRARAETL